MLPLPNSPDFPLALKEIREKQNFSFHKLSEIACIDIQRLRSYEDIHHPKFCHPRLETWRTLNRVFTLVIDEEIVKKYFEPKKRKARPISRLPGVKQVVIKTKCVPDPNRELPKQNTWFPF